VACPVLSAMTPPIFRGYHKHSPGPWECGDYCTLTNGQRCSLKRLNFKIRYILEIPDQRTVKTVKDRKMRFIDLTAEPCASSQHLLPQYSGFDRTEKNDEFQRRNIYARAEHVYRHNNLGIGTIAEFPDFLQRTVHIGISCDLLNKFITLIENLTAYSYQLVGMGCMRQIVYAKDQSLREMSRGCFMLISVFGNFFNYLFIAARSRDLSLDFFG